MRLGGEVAAEQSLEGDDTCQVTLYMGDCSNCIRFVAANGSS